MKHESTIIIFNAGIIHLFIMTYFDYILIAIGIQINYILINKNTPLYADNTHVPFVLSDKHHTWKYN